MLGRHPVRRLVDHAPRHLTLLLIATVVAAAASITGTPPPADAAVRPKVVVVVGPTHGATARYLERARRIASQARSLGARVVEIYTPRATWKRVRAAARGAHIFIYLGHGNGSPSPYGPLNRASMNGLGLNPSSGAKRNAPVKYYGESYVRHLDLAPKAAVLLNHLCYASGNGEEGSPEPGWSVARKRVDNYAAGFIRAGAGAVLADGHTDLSFELRVLLGTKGNLIAAWRADLANHGNERRFSSVRSPGFINLMDPDGKSTGFYRALTTRRGFSSRQWPAAPKASPAKPRRAEAFAKSAVKLRAAASTAAKARATLRDDSRMVVTAGFVADRKGRTWVAVRTPSTRVGYVAGWLLRYRGTVVTKTTVIVRAGGSTAERALFKLPKGKRVTILTSWSDRRERTWFRIKTGTGRVGWVASWLTRP